MADQVPSSTQKPVAIRVIETTFNGQRYRSRLEARWAVFLDVLAIGFRYEPEGYVVNGEPYLPDFYLPTLNAFLEIKPVLPAHDSREDRVARGLAQGTGQMVYIQAGPLVADIDWRGDPERFAHARAYFPDGVDDDGYLWCECAPCGFIGLAFEGRSARLPCGCWRGSGNDRAHNADSLRLLTAYDLARDMRFEFRRDFR